MVNACLNKLGWATKCKTLTMWDLENAKTLWKNWIFHQRYIPQNMRSFIAALQSSVFKPTVQGTHSKT